MDRQPHNNLWAEKLLQVSMPDSGEAWAGMEVILDRELQQRLRSDWRRWLLVLLLLLLLIGVCNCPGRGRLFHRSGHDSRISGALPATPAKAPAGGNPASPATATPVSPENPVVQSPATAANAAAPEPTTRATRHNRRTLAVTPSGRPTPAAPRGSSVSATPTAFGDVTQTAPDGSPVAKTSFRRPPAKSNLTAAGDTVTKKNVPAASDTAGKKSTPVLPKAVSRKDTLHRKPPPPPQEEDQKEKDHGWVFGIGLNQFFPIGGQRGSTYNADGLTGTLSDYLPVPMIRYYFSHKAYLQVEAQLNTPQATKKNLVFNSVLHDSTSIPGENVQTSATLQQLYYFNIPLSFHYAVTDELNIGTGLQFSHLGNAIGNFDSTLTNLRTLEVTNPKDTKSFKDDTLYRRIRTNEFRFLADASYTWKHIVLGVRYNQALSKFINVPLPTGGSTQSRNSSLQIYVRYILWDTRKKKKQGPP